MTSYRILLPPGWRQVPLDDTAGKVIEALLDELLDGVPRDSATPWRGELRKSLMAQVEAGREAGALDFYLPVEAHRGRPAAASFLVAHAPGEPAPPGTDGVALLLASLVDTEGATPAQVGGQPSVRLDVVEAPDPEAPTGVQRSTRRVTYQVSVPGGGWLFLAFSTLLLLEQDNPMPPNDPEGPRFDDVLVDLFDAIVTTLRWKDDS